MFLAEAIADFSSQILLNQNKTQQSEKAVQNDQNPQQQKQRQQQLNQKQDLQSKKRARQQQHQNQLSKQQNTVVYLKFKKGDKIVTRMTYQNGWWFGNVIKSPDLQGYFPSTFVKVGTEAPLPQIPPQTQKQDWLGGQLQKINKGPVQSEYYQGITGYKMVKIDDKNKNILKGNYVKFDSGTGLAKVPIKSQDPTAKAVRQMGYYFDYHEWCQQRNNGGNQKARPDVRRKKKKKLNLILFGDDKNKNKK